MIYFIYHLSTTIVIKHTGVHDPKVVGLNVNFIMLSKRKLSSIFLILNVSRVV